MVPVSAFDVDDVELAEDAVVPKRGTTFWVDRDAIQVSRLEGFALGICEFHEASLGLPRARGVEWWVQHREENDGLLLHYDKDETLWEHGGIMRHPTIATVTYLTTGYPAPLVVYADGLAAVAVPRKGKHVAFRGSLLHGVPAELAPFFKHPDACCPRISLCVNVWHERVPLSVLREAELPRTTVPQPLEMRRLPCFRTPVLLEGRGLLRLADHLDDRATPPLPFARHDDPVAVARRAHHARAGLLLFDFFSCPPPMS